MKRVLAPPPPFLCRGAEEEKEVRPGPEPVLLVAWDRVGGDGKKLGLGGEGGGFPPPESIDLRPLSDGLCQGHKSPPQVLDAAVPTAR